MLRTLETLLCIAFLGSALVAAGWLFTLPSEINTVDLNYLAYSALSTLDRDGWLQEVKFSYDDPMWSELATTLSSMLPAKIVYNLTVYHFSEGAIVAFRSISNANWDAIKSDVSSAVFVSSNASFHLTPEKIGEHGGGVTLYLLNCSDAKGWWITGHTGQSIAEELYTLLSPYFETVIFVQNTLELGTLLNGTKISSSPDENVTNAVIINTFGEAVPIPFGYYASDGVGYDPVQKSYARYFHTLGNRTRQYNWTWVSIVGFPMYYVTNTVLFANDHNGWGIYGMKQVGLTGTVNPGLNAFLQGMDGQNYTYSTTSTVSNAGVVYLSSSALDYGNYYGLFPMPYATATRALSSTVLSAYNLTAVFNVFNVGNSYPGSVFRNVQSGAFYPLGLSRVPDSRLTALGLLGYYKPQIYATIYTAANTTRTFVLQLKLVGGGS
jgi:hypothetical protein